MTSPSDSRRLTLQAVIGFVAGVAIAAVDNFAFGGEVSPIVIVALLFAVSTTAGVIWSWRGWRLTAVAWVCVPLAHLLKHILGLPDTLRPDTYTSILMLAGFTIAIAAIGNGCGALLRRLVTGSAEDE